jgi:hypothetical protein
MCPCHWSIRNGDQTLAHPTPIHPLLAFRKREGIKDQRELLKGLPGETESKKETEGEP